jgi:hypothetical protein
MKPVTISTNQQNAAFRLKQSRKGRRISSINLSNAVPATWRVKGDLSGFSQSCGHFFKGCRQIRFIFTELCDLSSEFKDLMVLLADLIQ